MRMRLPWPENSRQGQPTGLPVAFHARGGASTESDEGALASRRRRCPAACVPSRAISDDGRQQDVPYGLTSVRTALQRHGHGGAEAAVHLASEAIVHLRGRERTLVAEDIRHRIEKSRGWATLGRQRAQGMPNPGSSPSARPTGERSLRRAPAVGDPRVPVARRRPGGDQLSFAGLQADQTVTRVDDMFNIVHADCVDSPDGTIGWTGMCGLRSPS